MLDCVVIKNDDRAGIESCCGNVVRVEWGGVLRVHGIGDDGQTVGQRCVNDLKDLGRGEVS